MIESGGQSVLLEAMHYLASVKEHMLHMPFASAGHVDVLRVRQGRKKSGVHSSWTWL